MSEQELVKNSDFKLKVLDIISFVFFGGFTFGLLQYIYLLGIVKKGYNTTVFYVGFLIFLLLAYKGYKVFKYFYKSVYTDDKILRAHNKKYLIIALVLLCLSLLWILHNIVKYRLY